MRRSPSSAQVSRVVLACVAASLFAASLAFAQIPDLVWEPVAVIDQPVFDVASGSGASLVFANGEWHIVYVLGGDIYHRAYLDTGWLEREPLTHDGLASDPHIAEQNGVLHVVWEDRQCGISEVWTRRFESSTWSPETCLTCDAVPSRAPVVAADYERALVVWEEGTPKRRIEGMMFWDGWQPRERLSLGLAESFQPTVSGRLGIGFHVAWVDTRNGSPGDIWLRKSAYPDGWEDEQQISTGICPCARPSIVTLYCCGDLIFAYSFVAFETATGRIYLASSEGALMPFSDAGSSAEHPSVGGFPYIITIGLGGYTPVALVSWTTPEGGPTHRVAEVDVNGSSAREDLTGVGLASSVVAGAEGYPRAGILAAWIEDRGGVPTLVARRGTLPGGMTGVGDRPTSSGIELSITPNPSADRARLVLETAAAATIALSVFDVAGQRVRALGERQGVGRHAWEWDLRDAAGARVRPGLYFAIARGDASARRTIVVLR